TPLVFYLNATPHHDIYTLSLHDALPISHCTCDARLDVLDFDRGQRPANGSGNGIDAVAAHLDSPTLVCACGARSHSRARARWARSEEHTSELQSRFDLVCRLLLEKKKL